MKNLKKLLNIRQINFLSDKTTATMLVINLTFLVLQLLYIIFHYQYLNSVIPFWYTKPWGDYQLAAKWAIFLIPFISFSFIAISCFFLGKLYQARNKEGINVTLTMLTISISFLSISSIRIIEKASSPFPPLVSPRLLELIPLLIIGFVVCALIVPYVIKFAKKYDIITDPAIHKHPGMLLKKPSARAGAVAFYIAFLLISLIFIPLTRETAGLYIGTLITTLIGLADDKKNINPYIRLLLMPIAIIITLMISDLHIYYFANPFNGTTIRLDFLAFPLKFGDFKFVFLPVADLFAVVWILWFMNMLSWSNAVDGQFSGMAAITCIITAVLALRLIKIDVEQLYVAKMAAIAAGACLGILPYNWHPSKIMWGFGATTIGLLIPVLSIMAGTKVAVATLVLIVPTLDSLITIIRRVLQKKSPLWGDRGHLHHRLLDRGWSQQKVAVFYWIITAVFGGVALISSGRSKILALLTIGGIVAFTLVVMNLQGELSKLKSRQSEK